MISPKSSSCSSLLLILPSVSSESQETGNPVVTGKEKNSNSPTGSKVVINTNSYKVQSAKRKDGTSANGSSNESHKMTEVPEPFYADICAYAHMHVHTHTFQEVSSPQSSKDKIFMESFNQTESDLKR